MRKKIDNKIIEGTFGKMQQVEDFLPSPEVLAKADEVVKVTIGLSSTSIDFFKKEAKKHNASYQKMIRRVVDSYVAKQG